MTSANICRRRLIRWLALAPIASAIDLSTPAFAQSDAPPTWLPAAVLPYVPYISAAAGVVSIVSAIVSFSQTREMISQLGQINAKLDQVLQNQQAILAAIHELPAAMEQAVLSGWENSYGRDINAYAKDFAAACVAKDQKDPSIQRLWQALAISVPETASRLGDCDYGVLPWFGQAIAICIAAFRLQRLPVESRRAYFGGFTRQMNRWLDADNPRSIPAGIVALQRDIDNRRKVLGALPAKVYLSSQREVQVGGGELCARTDQYYVNISGNFETGYKGSQSMEASAWECTEMFRRPRTFSVAPPAPSVATPTVPEYVPSGFVAVDSRNQERTAIYQQMAKAADLPHVIEQIRYLQAQLRIAGSGV